MLIIKKFLKVLRNFAHKMLITRVSKTEELMEKQNVCSSAFVMESQKISPELMKLRKKNLNMFKIVSFLRRYTYLQNN